MIARETGGRFIWCGQGGWVGLGLVIGLCTSCLSLSIQLCPLGIGLVAGYIDAIIAGTSERFGSLQDLFAGCLIQNFGSAYVGIA